MTLIRLDGLDGTNPLHVLAAFGALLLSDDLDGGGARLGWQQLPGGFVPRIATTTSAVDWCGALAERLRAMSIVKVEDPAAKANVNAQKATLKKMNEGKKKLREAIAQEAKSLGLLGPAKKAHGQPRLLAAEAEFCAQKKRVVEAEEALSATLGFGPAHLGEVIRVPPQIFRLHARHAIDHDPAAARQLASLASDGCLEDGNVTPTHYSFSNGASGKQLLKDFRRLAAMCTAERVQRSVVLGNPDLQVATALNWDPADLRSYAHQWNDPGGTKANAKIDVVANALAYVGLGLMTCFPGRRELEAIGFIRRNPGAEFTWPLWDALLPVAVVRATLAAVASDGFAAGRDAARARGLLGVYTAARINPNKKRNFFAPATPRQQ